MKKFLLIFFALSLFFALRPQPSLAVVAGTTPTTPTCAEITTARTQALVSFCHDFDNNPTECLRRDPLPGTTDTYQPCERNTAGSLCLPASGAAGVLCAWEKERGGCTGECATAGLQQPQAEKPPLRIVPRLQINIPTLKPFSPEDIKFEGPVGDRYVVVPFIAQYIVAIYKYGISLAFIVSIVLVMVAGFRWMTAGGNAATIGQAKGMIGNTSIGLIILLGSYLILNTINPDLIKTGVLRIKYIEPNPLEVEPKVDETASEGELPDTGNCSDSGFAINSIDGVDMSLKGQVQSLISNKNKYQTAAQAAGIPWEVLAAVHMKESGGTFGKSILNGKELCNRRNDTKLLSWCPECQTPSVENDLLCGAKKIKQKAPALSSNTTDLSAIKLAFCKYNGCPSKWQGCPEASPYVGPLFDANHQTYAKQRADCVPVRCRPGCTGDATGDPRTNKGCCSIKVWTGQPPTGAGVENACNGVSVPPACQTPVNAQTVIYEFNPNEKTGSNTCGSWVKQGRIGALTIYALLKKSQ